MPEEVDEGWAIPIIRTNPSGLKAEFVNDFAVTNTSDAFFLTFSVIEPPAVMTTEDIEAISKVEAVALAKFVVTPAIAKSILAALTDNIRKFEKRPGSAQE